MSSFERRVVLLSAMLGIIILLSICLFHSCSEAKDLKTDRDRWKSNTEVLYNKQQEYIINDSIHVSRQKALEMKVKDYESLNKDFEKQIKSLKASNKIQPTSYTKVVKRDTLYIDESTHDTTYIRDFKDTCIAIDTRYYTYIRCGDDVQIMTADTIHQVISKNYKHKFLWWRWGNDGVKQDLWSSNPNSHFVFDEFVKFDN